MGKLFKCFAKSKRGVSTVIGVVFFTLVILMGSSLIIWEITQYDAYMQVANERDRLDWERENEIIDILSVSVVGDSLNISVINRGAVMAHLVDLWVTEYLDTTANWHTVFDLRPYNYYLNSGSTATNIGRDIETLVVDPKLTYVIKVVTERGNVVTGIYSQFLLEPSPPVHAFGVFSLDWFYFKYTSETYPEPRSSGSISKAEDYIAFYIKVTNNWHESVTLLGPSMIMLLIDHREPLFHIVNDVYYAPYPYIIPYEEGDPMTVAPEESVELTFAAEYPYGTGWRWSDSRWPWSRGGLPIGVWQGNTPEGAIAMTALVFTIGDSPEVQAQSLPFRALVLDE